MIRHQGNCRFCDKRLRADTEEALEGLTDRHFRNCSEARREAARRKQLEATP